MIDKIRSHVRGFSLPELAVILVVIGLITAAALNTRQSKDFGQQASTR